MGDKFRLFAYWSNMGYDGNCGTDCTYPFSDSLEFTPSYTYNYGNYLNPNAMTAVLKGLGGQHLMTMAI